MASDMAALGEGVKQLLTGRHRIDHVTLELECYDWAGMTSASLCSPGEARN
jgi:hypothetical protein